MYYLLVITNNVPNGMWIERVENFVVQGKLIELGLVSILFSINFV